MEAPDHPSGLYWFHPHPHGLSEVQVSNGLSGLMSIGGFWDTAYIKCRVTAFTDIAGLALAGNTRRSAKSSRRSTRRTASYKSDTGHGRLAGCGPGGGGREGRRVDGNPHYQPHLWDPGNLRSVLQPRQHRLEPILRLWIGV